VPLVALPLLTAVVLTVVPSRYPNGVRFVSLVSAALLFALSLYVFFAYEFGEGADPFQFEGRWEWLENVGFLAADGITIHFGVDGIAAPMVLLNGIVAFTAC
jgi:NADH-quinone oxidoreductase subunit M